jgi:hypothetical protein
VSRLLIAAVLTYIAICLYMGLSLPGLQYDEAIYEHGAVALITGDASPDFARDGFPLMVISYAGAAKFYLLAIPFAVFGTAPAVGRVVSMLLGALGIFGIGRAVQLQAGDSAGAAVAFALAIHPEYVSWTLYDNSGAALWMANCGLVALALSRFLQRRDRFSALLLGAASGFAVWGRMNFLWILAGLAIASMIVFHWRPRFAAALAAGFAAGAAPLIVYELATRFRTFRTPATANAFVLFRTRLEYASSALLYDGERAAMWGGAAPPYWQTIACGAVVVLAGIVLFLSKSRDRIVLIGRWAVIAAAVAYALAFLTPLGVNAHHFAALLPLPAIVVCLAAAVLCRHGRIARAAVVLLAAAYAIASLEWNRAAHAGLAATHGVGMWSDAIAGVSRSLEQQRREVAIVDWGLANNLYVLTRARVPFRELFWRADVPWNERVSRGGLFLLNAPANTHFARSAAAFLRALQETHAAYSVTTFRQHDGAEYARLYDVRPQSLPLHAH